MFMTREGSAKKIAELINLGYKHEHIEKPSMEPYDTYSNEKEIWLVCGGFVIGCYHIKQDDYNHLIGYATSM